MNLTKPKPTNNTIRVCGQLTIKKEVALIAEESKLGYTKGEIVKFTSRSNYTKMRDPKECRVLPSGRVECVMSGL